MSSGKTQRGEECTGNLPASQLEWVTRRLVFDQAAGRSSAEPIGQPTTLTEFGTFRSPYSDPGICNVILHNVVTVRNINPAAPQDQADPLVVYNAFPLPQVSKATADPMALATRGSGTPQFRLTFGVGDPVQPVLYVDGNCIVSMPALSVKVEALTQALLVPPTEGAIPAGAPQISGILTTEARASVGIQWGKGMGVSGPQGMVTFTQCTFLDNNDPTQNVIFQRPPFARRVVAIPPRLTAGTWTFLSEHRTLAAPTILATPPGVANQNQQFQDIPHAAQAIMFTPSPPQTASDQLSVVWEIGVR